MVLYPGGIGETEPAAFGRDFRFLLAGAMRASIGGTMHSYITL
jgi:hypothetical protein